MKEDTALNSEWRERKAGWIWKHGPRKGVQCVLFWTKWNWQNIIPLATTRNEKREKKEEKKKQNKNKKVKKGMNKNKKNKEKKKVKCYLDQCIPVDTSFWHIRLDLLQASG